MNKIILLVLAAVSIHFSQAQPGTDVAVNSNGRSFIDIQRGFQRPNESINKKEAYLKNLFQLKGVTWPAKYMYIREYKYDSQLEVWVKNTAKEQYKLLKIYKVCALAGTMGPKRFEGDYQVPEGFYYINEFNPNSTYYLSLGLNYPNASDKILGDPAKPGGDIYIHGGCATVGCIPILNEQIDELYVLCANAKSAGLDFIPVHIFPINFGVKKSYEYLAKLTKDDQQLKKFSEQLERAYDYFEKYKEVPVVMVKDNGEYVVNNALPLEAKFQPRQRPKSNFVPITRKIGNIATAVAKSPEYPGGAEAFGTFLKTLGKEMVPLLPEEVTKAFAQVEFIIDSDGTPVNFKVIKGVDDYFNNELISRMEKMPKWSPAIAHEKPVAKKMVQTVVVGGND